MANPSVTRSFKWRTIAVSAVPLIGFALAFSAARAVLSSDVERSSLNLTLTLGVQVTVICLCLAPLPAYAAARYFQGAWLQKALVSVAMISFLIPTIARTLVISSLFSYYGPVAILLRAVHLWPLDTPFDSSHPAVVLSLVTLYLPITILVMIEGVGGLGRAPDIAATLGAGPWQTGIRVVLPGLQRSIILAALLVFSQVLGVIVTPRILGSGDVTLAMLIDDLLKKQLDTHAALGVALAELIVAAPIALLAAAYLRRGIRASRSALRPKDTSRYGWVVTAPFIVILLILPLGLLLLAAINSNVLAIDQLSSHGLTFRWFAMLPEDASLVALIKPSLATWAVASLVAVGGGTLLTFFSLGTQRLHSALEWAALLTLFVPQNVLAVLFSLALNFLKIADMSLPPWFLGGVGQAIPSIGISILLVSRSLRAIESKLNVAATLGASPIQRLRLTALPNIGTALIGAMIAVTLTTMDDVLFVRYIPGQSLDTFATEMFARARYSASPELAAAAITIIGAIIVAMASLWITTRLFRKLVASETGRWFKKQYSN